MNKIFFMVAMLLGINALAQEPHIKNGHDTTTLAYALRKGSDVDLHLRLYYMSTDNEKDLSDYYALAFGGGLKYQTGIYKGFQFTVGGFFVWNLASSDLTQRDPTTGVYNRYEVGQFDMEDFSNKNDMDRLEDFNLKYHYKRSTLTYGKQNIQTPFINPQDGRMRPTGEQGFWLDLKEIKKTRIQAGWLTKISPRGTVRWFDIDESIGIYPTGVNTEGGKSGYKGNLSSSGVGVLGITYQLKQPHLQNPHLGDPGLQNPEKSSWSVQAWEFYTQNMFNTILLQTDAEWSLGGKTALITGLQYIHQSAINDGGNSDLQKTYFDPRHKSNLFSGRLGVKTRQDRINLNYTRITADGRFLFPREWGREPMYTFLKRERNEGAGDVNAFSVNYLRTWNRKFNSELGYGYYDMPGVTNTALNKYAMPSYHQVLADVSYNFSGFFKGLQVEALYTFKLDAEGIESGRLAINKVNMHHFNVILNYHL